MLWPFAAGILTGIFVPYPDLKLVLSLIFGTMLVGYWWIHRKGRKLGWFHVPMFFLAGYLLVLFSTEQFEADHHADKIWREKSMFYGKISADPVPRGDGIKSEIDLQLAINGSDTFQTNGTIIAFFDSDSGIAQLGYGDEIWIRGYLNRVKPPQNPGEFDYQAYLRLHQISHQIFVGSGQWSLVNVGSGLVRTIKDWQHETVQILKEKGSGKRELAILSALLVGYKHHLEADQVAAFAGAGAMHVLAVSGLHVGIIFLLLSSLLSPLDRFSWGQYARAALALCVLWMYAALTGLSPSVTRATTMFSFIAIAQIIGRNTDIYNTLAASAFLLLILEPYMLLEVGFQLSYLAVFGIVYIQPRLYRLWSSRWWVIDQIWALTTVSIAAQIATFPIALYYFHQFPVYFLISNIVVIPAVSLIIPFGVATIAISWIPFIGGWVANTLFLLVHWVDRFILWMYELPGAVISGIHLDLPQVYFMYLLIICVLAFWIRKHVHWLMAGLVSLSIFVGYSGFTSFNKASNHEITFYKVRGVDVVSVNISRRLNIYSNVDLNTIPQKVEYHLQPNWDRLAPDDTHERILTTGVYEMGTYSLMVLDSQNIRLPSSRTDFLFVLKRTYEHPQTVLDSVSPSSLVLSQNLDWKTRAYWKSEGAKRGIEVHDVSLDGAVTYRLNNKV